MSQGSAMLMVTPLHYLAAPDGSHAAPWDDFLSELTLERIAIEEYHLDHSFTPVGGHAHESLFYLTRGTATFNVKGVDYAISEGAFFHLRPGQGGQVRASAPSGVRLLEMRFSAQLLGEISLSDLVEIPVTIQPGVNSVVGSYFVAAFSLTQMAPIGRQQCLRSLAMLTIIALVRDHVPDAAAMLGRAHVVQIRRLLPAIRLLRTNVGSVHTVESLARSCHLSVAQFRRLFSAKFEMPPTRYIQKMRVREACRLLNSSDQTVSEICVRIGYEQPSHFHKTFKRLVGRTPSTYRGELMAARGA